MSDVSGIPYMGPMGMGGFFASPYPALSGGGNMTAGQISAPYAGPSAYNQSVVNNLFSSGGGFGVQTDYYSQLAANQLSALTPNTFNMSNAGSGMTLPQLSQLPSDQLFTSGTSGVPYLGGGGAPFGGGGFGGLGGGDVFSGGSGVDYGALYGGGGGVNPFSPAAYGGGGGGGGLGGYDYGALYGGGGGVNPFSPATYAPSGGIDYGALYGGRGGVDPFSPAAYGGAGAGAGGGGFGGLSGGWGNAPQAMPDMQRLLGYNSPSQYDIPAPPIQPQPMGYDYGSLYGGGGGNLGSRLAQTLAGGVDPAWPAAQRSAGLVGPTNSAFNFDPSTFSRGYGNEGGFGGDPHFGGFGQGGRDSIGGGVYDPFNVGGAQPLVGAEGAGPGGGRGGGLFQGGFAGAGGTQTPDIQRLLGYTPDLQLGISGLQKTLREIDAATARGDRGLEPGFWERAIPDPISALSSQDRDIPFRGPGGGSAGAVVPYSDQNPSAGFELPPEIARGGSAFQGDPMSRADPYPGFAGNLFGNAPAYPSGVVTGPYALPDVGVEGGVAGAPGAARGGALPFTSGFGSAPGGLDRSMTSSPYFDEPAAGFGGAFMPPQQQSFEDPAAGFGGAFSRGGDNRFMLPDVTNEERTFPMLDSPNIRDRIVFGGIGNGKTGGFDLPLPRYYGSPGSYLPMAAQERLMAQRAPLMDQLDSNPEAKLRAMGTMFAEMHPGRSAQASDERTMLAESFFNREAARGREEFSATGRDSPINPRPSYYESAMKGKVDAAMRTLRNDPELYRQVENDLREAGRRGSNLSNYATENASNVPSDQVAAKAMSTQSLGAYAPLTNEYFTRKDLPQFAERGWGGEHGGPPTQTFKNWYDALTRPRFR